MPESTPGRQVELADAINEVRAELLRAQSTGASEDLRFRLGEVTLELAVELGRQGGGEAAVKVWVVNLGANATVSSTRTHTVTVTMTPETLGEDGQWHEVRVADAVVGRPPAAGRR